ncbi:MAG: EamA family transporter [Patescibacteria group bacterium]
MWVLYAFLAAGFAALVAIFGKIGLKGIDSTLATTVRGIIMALFLVCVAFAMRKFDGFSLHSFTGREWVFIILAGIAGALSWLFYFSALRAGPAGAVSAIDRLSIVFVVILAAIFLGEAFTWKIGIGALLMASGAILIAF